MQPLVAVMAERDRPRPHRRPDPAADRLQAEAVLVLGPDLDRPAGMRRPGPRYRRADLGKVVDAINATGYGLTLGVHSRIDETIDFITSRAHVGNIYVNRNIVGAVVGGYLFTALGATGVTGFNLYSMFVAIVGAAVLLWLYHAIAGRS